jgi:uncharacterized glyoxalase superfamily protein PhnB
MADNEPVFHSSVMYQDDRAALEWLERAFGFEISMIVTDENDKIVHSEMKFGTGEITVAREYSEITKSPKSLGGMNTQHLAVRLEKDLDAHYERARKAGAKIVAEPADQFYGDRTYRCLDPEGHLWVFSQRVHLHSIEQMEANTGNTIKIRTHL